MPPIPDPIADFLLQHHVLSLATQDEDGLWAASCFYAADLAQGSLLLLSSLDTRHGAAMARHPHVAGTISGQPETLTDIVGVQFTALATPLGDADAKAALAIYCRRHPLARLGRHQIWRLSLERLKHTSNRWVFGQKTHWQRQAAANPAQVVDGADKSQ